MKDKLEPVTLASQEPKNRELKNREALSLTFDGNQAPEVAAKGFAELAERIIEKAKEQNILIHQDPNLLKRLQELDIGESIPPNMYVIIAELIAFSYIMRGKFPDSWQ